MSFRIWKLQDLLERSKGGPLSHPVGIIERQLWSPKIRLRDQFHFHFFRLKSSHARKIWENRRFFGSLMDAQNIDFEWILIIFKEGFERFSVVLSVKRTMYTFTYRVENLIAVHILKKPHHQFRLSRITCFFMKITNILRHVCCKTWK